MGCPKFGAVFQGFRLRSEHPSNHLGVYLGAPYKSSRVSKGVKERFQKRLALWKRRDISKDGRQTLIKSTLSSLPIYPMFLFVIPKRVVAKLEKIQRDFLLGREDLVQKPHFVNWLIVCMEKQKGGVWVLKAFLFSIRPCWGNGIGDLCRKGTLFGNG